MPALGIELDDIRIKRVDYIEPLRRQVESRMTAERFRSEAARDAEKIRGEADAEATRIYGEAFGAYPELYAFFRTLENYQALGESSTLMLKADSDFFRYLEDAQVQ